MLRRLKTILHFALVPGLSLLSTLFILPLVAVLHGSNGWVSLTLGQSIGALASVVVGMGWPVVGPTLIASLAPADRSGQVLLSLGSRGICFLAALPIAAFLAILLIEEFRLTGVLFALGTMLNGFTFSWFYAGVGSPSALIRNEASIRLVGNVLAIPLLFFTKSLTCFAVLLLVVGLAMLGRNYLYLRQGDETPWPSLRACLHEVGRQAALTGSRTFVAAGQYLSGGIVAATSPTILPNFTALDRIQKSAANATEAIPAGLASWVGQPSGREAAMRRIAISFWTMLGVGVVIPLVWLPSSSLVTALLFSDQVEAGPWAQAFMGAGIGLYAASTGIAQLVMVPLGRAGAVALVSYVGSAVTIAGVLLGSRYGGLEGALVGASSGNLAAVSAYAWMYSKFTSGPRRTSGD